MTKRRPPPAPVMDMVLGRSSGDCAIAALASFVGRTYEDVLAYAVQLSPRAHRHGLWIHEIEAIAAHFDVPLRRRRDVDLEDKELDGLLSLGYRKSREGHIAVLRSGLVFDVDGTAWEPATFLATRGYVVKSLLERR